MKRKFALLTVLGALLALAIPASSFGAMYPAGSKFEMPGNLAYSPTLSTSLGNCAVKATGQIPTTEYQTFPIALAAGTCSSGASLAFSGEWQILPQPLTRFSSAAGGITMKFASLPGCKLTGTALNLYGEWFNSSPRGLFLADSEVQLTWAAEGGSCALAGTHEWVDFRSLVTAGTAKVPAGSYVLNLTNPNTPITVGP
jgi:hypothetical protein